MVILAVVLQCIGFFLLYQTSRRADLRFRLARDWAQRHRIPASAVGCLCIVASFVSLAMVWSVATSLATGTRLLMIVSSLIVVLFPLKSL